MIAALAAAREAAGLSQRDLSAKLKRSFTFAYYVEAGERQLTVCEFIDYCRACGADPAKLMKAIAA